MFYSEMHATVTTGENFKVFRDTFLTLFWHFYKGAWRVTGVPYQASLQKCHKKCQKSVTKDFEIFPGGNSSVRLAVMLFN